MSVLSFLNMTADVYAKTETTISTDSAGNVWTKPASASYTIPCTIQSPSARGDDRWGREGQQRTPTMFILYEDRAKVNDGDQVVIDGITYAATSDPNDDAGRGAYARYSLQYLSGGGTRGGAT